MNERLRKKDGITLIALVITIIMLLILAGVAISTLTGDNGLLEKTQYSAEQMKVAKFKDEAGLAYMEIYSQNAQNQNYVVTLDELISLLQEDYGYSIAQTGGNVTGIKVYQKGKEVNATNAVKVEKSTEENITVVLQGANKYVELNGMYYPISLSGSEITVGEGENLTPSNSNLTITGASKVTATVTGLTIKLTGGATTGDDTLTITYGDKNAIVKATVTETGAGVGGGSEPEEPAVTYTVTFNTNGGSSVDAQTIQSGGKATKPSTSPTREGYYFIEWFSDSGLTTEYDFNTSVNADTTIYAKWVEKITFYVGTTTYHAQSGMNWSQWIDSGMEGSNQFRYDNALVKDNTGFERYLDNVSPTSQIQNGATYSWSTGGGGGA